MGRMGELPSRREVQETVEQHETDLSEKLEELDTIADDTETVRDTVDGLELASTAEGADAIKAAMEAAEDVTVEIFDRKDDNLEDIQGESEDHQSELQERSDTSEGDLGKISEASGRIETQETVNELGEAEAAVQEDIDFLNEEIAEENDAREQAERDQQSYQSRVHGGGR